MEDKLTDLNDFQDDDLDYDDDLGDDDYDDLDEVCVHLPLTRLPERFL